MRGPRDRIYGRYLARENPWLQLQDQCVLLNVRLRPDSDQIPQRSEETRCAPLSSQASWPDMNEAAN
jgi:hypothetical protein